MKAVTKRQALRNHDSMEQLAPLVRVRAVEPLEGFTVRLTFEDSSQKIMDLEPLLRGPIFEPVRNDLAVFRAIAVEGGTVDWPNGADIDPDVLYYDLTPAWMETELQGVR